MFKLILLFCQFNLNEFNIVEERTFVVKKIKCWLKENFFANGWFKKTHCRRLFKVQLLRAFYCFLPPRKIYFIFHFQNNNKENAFSTVGRNDVFSSITASFS